MTNQRYPDNHPMIRDNVVTITTPTNNAQYLPREVWEKTVAERDEYRRVLALISAWRITSGTRDGQLDALLQRVGETYDCARAMQDLLASLRENKARPAEEEVVDS